MKDLREHVVPGRLTAALVGLVGVLLAAPSLVFPTHAVLRKPQDPPDPDLAQFRLSVWSWGRIAQAPGMPDGQIEVGDTAGLVLLVVALAVGLAAVFAYAVRPGTDGRLLGAAGIAWAASQVVGGLGRRVGDTLSALFDQSVEVVVETSPVGYLELVSAVLLVVALALVVLRPVVALVRSAATRTRALARRQAARDEAADAQAAARSGATSAPRVGIATIRDVPGGPDARAAARRERSGTGVGFSDDPAPDPERFRPPR